MESPYFGHQHPLVFFNEEQSKQFKVVDCARCGEVRWGPCFLCADCGFYLHKKCAELPSQISHPFHDIHPFSLMRNTIANEECDYDSFCSFCGDEGENLVYRCSCQIDLHIRCALFTYKIAQKNFEELEGIDCKDPAIYNENYNKELRSAKCFRCWEPLLNSVYYSHCGFNLHKECVEQPFEIKYPLHNEHSLILQFHKLSPCSICSEIQQKGFVYYCSPCNFVVHVGCLSSPPPPIIEDKGHQHSFMLFYRLIPFTCDACGVEGNYVPYICLDSKLLVHKSCISLPRIIRFMWHKHPIFHTYSLESHEFENSECVVCRDDVKTKYGSYSCVDCQFIVHVNCLMQYKYWYKIVERDELEDNLASSSDSSINSFIVIEQDEDGKATKIKHFGHEHNLISIDNRAEDDKCCNGCALSISDSDSYYCCSECDFFLHKLCAELPKKMHFWLHVCQTLLVLRMHRIFFCQFCKYVGNGFVYTCDDCHTSICSRCLTPDTLTCQGHEHPLSYYMKYKGHCKACGIGMNKAYNCKKCSLALDWNCIRLPEKVRHKCDYHLLTLTYHENNSYSEYHFCDICEEDRNPNYWFYYCELCDTSAHPRCVLGRYPFIVAGRKLEGNTFPNKHQHSVTLVKKEYYYPKCFICGDPCQDLAVECEELECKFIAHWDCNAFSWLRERK